jgi:hypothetical protein
LVREAERWEPDNFIEILMPKKITVSCSGPIALSPKNQSPWEDVWLYWTGKPGRKRYCLGPWLCSKSHTEREYKSCLAFQADNHDLDYSEEIKQYGTALEAIRLGNIHIEDPNGKMPNIYTPAEFIDRVEAERLIAFLMKLHGFENIHCKWLKPKMVIIPV